MVMTATAASGRPFGPNCSATGHTWNYVCGASALYSVWLVWQVGCCWVWYLGLGTATDLHKAIVWRGNWLEEVSKAVGGYTRSTEHYKYILLTESGVTLEAHLIVVMGYSLCQGLGWEHKASCLHLSKEAGAMLRVTSHFTNQARGYITGFSMANQLTNKKLDGKVWHGLGWVIQVFFIKLYLINVLF